MFAYRYTDTNSTPKENSNPRNYHKSQFYCPGCDGNSGPAGWGRGGLRVGRCRLCPGSHSASGRGRFHSSNTPHSVPREQSLYCHLKSGPTLSQQPEPQKICGWRGGHDGPALCVGLAGSRAGLLLTTSLGWRVLEGSGCGDLAAGTWKQPEGARLKLGLPLWAQIPLGSEEVSDSCSLLFILFLLW